MKVVAVGWIDRPDFNKRKEKNGQLHGLAFGPALVFVRSGGIAGIFPS